MTIRKIMALSYRKVRLGGEITVEFAFASDLLIDALTIEKENLRKINASGVENQTGV